MTTTGAAPIHEGVRAGSGPARATSADPFAVSVATIGAHVSWLCATGKLVGDTAARDLADVVERQRVAGCRIAWLDLSQVPVVDRVGLDALVHAHCRFLAAGATLILTGVVARIARLLALTGLEQTLLTITAAADPPPELTRRWPELGSASDVDTAGWVGHGRGTLRATTASCEPVSSSGEPT